MPQDHDQQASGNDPIKRIVCIHTDVKRNQHFHN